MSTLPTPIRATLGLLATALDAVHELIEHAPELPMEAVGNSLKLSMRMQQQYAVLLTRGDEFIASLRGAPDEPPEWATFDDSPPSTSAGATDPADEALAQAIAEALIDDVPAAEVQDEPRNAGHGDPLLAAAAAAGGRAGAAGRSPTTGAPARKAPAKRVPAKRTSARKAPADTVPTELAAANTAKESTDFAPVIHVAPSEVAAGTSTSSPAVKKVFPAAATRRRGRMTPPAPAEADPAWLDADPSLSAGRVPARDASVAAAGFADGVVADGFSGRPGHAADDVTAPDAEPF